MTYEQLKKGIDNNTPIPSRKELWEAITKNDLKKYPIQQVEAGMNQKDTEGATLYHWAAQRGHLANIPKKLMNKENLLKTNDYDYTCLHIAAIYGHLHQIPLEILTEENLLKTDNDNQTCLHWAALKGHLHHIPKEILTPKNLLQEDRHNLTCFHKATLAGHLDQIPQELLTTENLLNTNIGWTCIHSASKNGQLDQIPQLSFSTLKKIKTYFETDSSTEKERVLSDLNQKITKLELIKQSLKKDHQEIL
jgi:ankyrin repeat protein